MRFTAAVALIAMTTWTGVARAQDTLNEPARAAQLRELIEQRFGERLRIELGLTNDQAGRMRIALAGLAARRRVMEHDERLVRQALAAQLRPGIAANPDSVGRLVDALTSQRIAYAQTFRDEMRELGTILTPVQRGQYLMARDRLMQRAQDAILEGRRNPPARVLRQRP